MGLGVVSRHALADDPAREGLALPLVQCCCEPKTRMAEIRRSSARWDGVSRAILVDPQAPSKASVTDSGKGPGISIEAVALGKPFTDPMWMREGVAIALAPLLSR